METDEILSLDWKKRGSNTSPGKRKPHIAKKSAFTKNKDVEELDPEDNYTDEEIGKFNKKGKVNTNINRRLSNPFDKDHTVIDIENYAGDQSSKKNREMVRMNRKTDSETETTLSSDEEKVRNVHNDGNSSETGGSQLDITNANAKTSSAMLLAEETSQILGSPTLRDGNIWNVLAFGGPREKTDEDREKWNKLMYYPSSNPVLESEKLLNDVEARVPSDEGLFVGEPTTLSRRNWNLLERRLITEKSLEWFGSDGKLLHFPDPYRPEPVQLYRDDQRQDEFEKNVVFKPAVLDPFQEFKIDPNQGYEIEIDLGTMNFVHHPYFSKEHVIAANLEAAFQEYSQRALEKVTDRAFNKLRALREAVAHTKDAISLMQKHSADESHVEINHSFKNTLAQQRQRLAGYRNEMRRCALARDRGYWDDKAAESSVLDAWKDLKNIREEQGYTNTSLKLNILELPTDSRDEREKWVTDLEDDFKDIEDEAEEIFETEMSRYRAKMKKWTGMRKRGKEGSGEGTDDSDISISQRPKPPVKPDADVEQFKKILEKRYKEIKRRPGEPKVIFDLVHTASVTPGNQLPEDAIKEQQRRKAVKKCKIELHLWFNGKEIFVSKPRDMSSDFTVFLGFKIPIGITEWPELLEIQVVETGTKMKTFLVPIPLPSNKTTVDRSQMQKAKFFSEDVIKTSHEGIGSGVPTEILGKNFDGLYPRGHITFRCGWSTNGDGKIRCPKGFESIEDKINSDMPFEDGQLKTLPGNSQLDPNNPQNVNLHRLAMHKGNHVHVSRKYSDEVTFPEDGFMIDKYMDEFEFCSMEKIDKSLRFRVLQLRDQGVPEFKNARMVPAYDRNISADVFATYERRLKEDTRKRMGETGLAKIGRKKLMDDDFVYESNRLEKIREMRLSVLQLFEKSLKQITFEDLVIEEQIPDIGTLGLNLMSFFQPRRPLRPIRKERKRIQASNLVDTKIGLIVNVVRAFNLPLRKDTDMGLLTTESMTGVQVVKKRQDRTLGNYSTVRPFVEVWFQRNVVRTTTALGSNPTWNQELQLNLSVPNDDYSQANLSKMDDLVYLLLYDEVSVDLLEDERRRETDIYQRLEKRWLGSITIPFSTLYTNGRIEGTFKINTPPILLGYEAQGMASHFGGINVTRTTGSTSNLQNVVGKSVGVPFNNQKNAFITIFITLQPAVQPTISLKEDSASGESNDMMAYVKTWKNTFEKRFPERFIRPFVMTAEGDTILCTRYLKPIEPPEIFLHHEGDIIYTMEDLAHYVSLFPSIRDSTLGITDYSLWFTSDVFAMTPGGGIEDHAVLLACFFMHLNIPCWIIQGNAIPDGPTTFVVTSFKGLGEDKGVSKGLKNVILIWNPCSGEYYNASDNFCPLQKVWAAIGSRNIWVNVAEGDRPHQIEWDIGKSKSWQPLFAKSVSEDKIPCIQTGPIKYKVPDQIQANSLAQRIERHLKEVFMKWRKTSKTNWNRYCSATLRRLLPKLEETLSGRSRAVDVPGTGSIESVVSLQSGSAISLNEEHLMELREVMTSYQMTGFPLQQPYVNMESITEAVHATGVHTIDTPDVEFAIAAYSHAYPASVYSVWIYVAALHRRK